MQIISIIMPIYNAEKTLPRAIDSILNQKLNNLEIILINDGSTDNTDKICREYKKKFDCIKYKKIKNGGVSNARNVGIGISTGDYIMFIDSDDTLPSNAIKSMFNEISKEDVDLVIAGYIGINETTGKEKNITIDNKVYSKGEFHLVIEKTQRMNLFNQLWNKIYKANIINGKQLKFDKKISLGEDCRFILSYIECIQKIKTSSLVAYNYTNTTDGLSLKYNQSRLKINLENVDILQNIYIKNSLPLTYIHKKYIITCLSGINHICKIKDKDAREVELNNFINNNSIKEKLSVKINWKYNLLSKILQTKNKFVLILAGNILNLYDRYKKKKLGY